MKKVATQKITSNTISLKKTALALSLVALMGTGLTACDKHPKEEHKHEEHKHDEHTHAEQDGHSHAEHEAHDHEHEHNHGEEHEHEHEHGEKVGHIGKHVHGEAELYAVIEGNSLNIELNSPAMNVFGFEHNPNTAEQKATVEKQEVLLKEAEKLFTISGGNCTFKDVLVTMPFDGHDADHSHESEHEHEEEHAHEEDEHIHNDEDGHDHAEGDVHSDVSATYSYACKNGADVKSIKVQVFNAFTGFTKINTNWVNGDKQGAQTLTKEAYNIAVK